MIDEVTLRKVQLLQLDMLKKVVEICNRHNIKYYMIGGTLLGAVRHRGFIPWDDDLDIAMFRDDYNHFLEICETELPSELFLQNRTTETGFWLFFTKIRLNDTIFDDNITVTAPRFHNGIFIDIFPLDDIPETDTLSQKVRYNILNILSRAIKYKNGYKKCRNFLIKFFCECISFLPDEFISKVADKLVCCYNGKDLNCVTSMCSQYGYHKQRMKKSIYGDGIKLQFEDDHFTAPFDYHSNLRQLFKDYMTPPPVEQRVIHHTRLKVDLGKYNT